MPRAKALCLAIAGMAAAISAPVALQAQNWNVEYVQTETGHRVGNPEAKTQLIAFVSYSCPACKIFEQASDAPLRAGYIHEGKLGMEVRLAIRNPIDLAASLAAECGPEDKFFDNHRAIMFAQGTWLPVFQNATPAQRARWSSGSHSARMKAIAADGGFYEIMERRGYRRAELDACLSDEVRARQLETIAEQTKSELGFIYTPSFALNGTYLEGVHAWLDLNKALDSASQ